MAYREVTTKERPPVVIHHRPMHILGTIGLVCFVFGLSAITLVQAVLLTRTSHLDCVRGGAHACVLVREYGPISTQQIFPLDQIRAVQVKTHSGKSTTYSVDFVMRDGRTEQLSRSGARAHADLTCQVIGQFLDGRAVSPSKIPIDEPSWGLAILMTVFGVGLGAASMLFLGTARLECDLDRGTIRYTRFRFPRRPIHRTFQVDDIKSARVTARPGSKGGTIFGVSIDLVDGEELELVPGGGGGQSRSDRAANEINALLGKMRAERGD